MDLVAELLRDYDLADPYCSPGSTCSQKTGNKLLPVWLLHISPVVDPKHDGEDAGRHHLEIGIHKLAKLQNAQPGCQEFD